MKPPASIVARPVGSNGRFRFEKKNGDVFQTSRVGFQTSTKAQLFRKTLRIARGLKGFARENRRRGVMTVRLVIVRTETRDDYVRTKSTNDPDDVGEDFVTIPNPQRLFRVFRKSEIDRTREELWP